jgi:hypothetical protein
LFTGFIGLMAAFFLIQAYVSNSLVGLGFAALVVLAVVAVAIDSWRQANTAPSVSTYRVWLDGTTVVVRGRTVRKVDLAKADVRETVTLELASSVNAPPRRVLALGARDRATGQEIKIPLRMMGRRLPAHELHALADAVMHGRQPSDPNYPIALALATKMRQMAKTRSRPDSNYEPKRASDAEGEQTTPPSANPGLAPGEE